MTDSKIRTSASLPALNGDDETLRRAKLAITDELAKPGGPTDISASGADELIQQNAEFIKEVGLRAIKIARKAGLDTVSRTHVREAVEALQSTTASRARTGALAFGGIAGGVGLQELIRLVNSATPIGKLEVVLAAAFLVAGTALLAYGLLSRKRR